MVVQTDVADLTVVVVSFSNGELLDTCLAALLGQVGDRQIEIIVVRAERPDDQPGSNCLGKSLPVKLVSAPAGTTVPSLRSLGICHSCASIVALIEDDCIVTPGWCVVVLDAHQSSSIAIGGPVEPGAYPRGLDWAVYFCDYVRFMRPFAGVVPALPGNNVSYKRHVLLEILGADSVSDGLYEVFVHESLQRAGHTLVAEAAMVVRHEHRSSLADVSLVPYHHGRGYGAMRAVGWSLARRSFFAGAATLLPLVKCGRILIEVGRRKRHRVRLIQSLPWMIVYCVCWSVGEAGGYLFGSGESLDRWR